ncbi:hypothetical protein GAPWKB11_0868 [Gilliamella apicola]|nr:hypothetical protein [Gilliamella apicola]KFA58979.1 hypothetical protein GAPWKB11_0868 [Gilliamella apicola]
MSWYKTGTINVTNGSNTVIGYNTKWTNPLIGVCSGQMLILQTQNTIEIYEIASIQSDTQLTLAKAYSGTNKTGITYEIPTSPKVSIESLALRVSEMLNYYQIQLDAWQSILTGDGEVTLTAPDGRVVTIRSQLSISNELVKLVEQSQGFAQSASKSATTATNASASAKSYSDSAKSYSDSASALATASRNSAQQSSNSANAAKTSENNAKTSEQNAAKSADEAKKSALSLDTSNFVKKSAEKSQHIDGLLDVKFLTEQDQRVYSPNNKPTADDIGSVPAIRDVLDESPIYRVAAHVVIRDMIGDQRLMPFRRNELPFGWYFRNGDNFLLSSPQGQALNKLSVNYKNDHKITIKTINGQQYINLPTAFSGGRGCFERAVDGEKRQVGSIETDAIRNITGYTSMYSYNTRDSGDSGAFRRVAVARNAVGGANPIQHTVLDNFWFDASLQVPTANENRPLNIGMTPAIYLGV